MEKSSRFGETRSVSQQEGIAEVMRGEAGATFHHRGDLGHGTEGSELVIG